jgi:hypothetical protein
VFGPQVAVAHVAAMGVDQRLEQVGGDAAGLVERELAVAGQPIAEGRALHRQCGEVPRLGHAALAQRDDVQLICNAATRSSASTTREPLRGGEPRIEHVEPRPAGVPPVARVKVSSMVPRRPSPHLIALGEAR